MGALETARAAYAANDWPAADEAFEQAARDDALTADDLATWSDTAWWRGDLERSLTLGEEAFRAFVDEERPRPAAMTAITLGVNRFLRGEDVIASGWLQRAGRLLATHPDSPEAGYLRYVVEVEANFGDVDQEGVAAAAREIQELGRRHDDPNLVALGILGEGRAHLRTGRLTEGLALLDEAMLAVLSDELEPAWAGNLYCNLMAACHEVAELRRAVAWTEATARWLATLPAAVVFTGICRVHRSQVLQLTGGWDEAEREARRVCEELEGIHVATTAEGHYQLGELRRLRGDLHGAEQAYTDAHRRGRDPQPGLALVRLTQGRVDDAAAAIRSALAGAPPDPPLRVRLHAAEVEIALARGDLDQANRALDAIDAVVADCPTCGFETLATQLRGTVMVSEDRAEEALPLLRTACRRWQELDAPYDAARTGVWLARALGSVGDTDTAQRELEHAVAVLERLGATTDLAALDADREERPPPGGLTEREVEVLRLVAAGMTNREVASTLVISEKTVARHLANIFVKLDVPSRTAAAAFAFEHGIAEGPRR